MIGEADKARESVSHDSAVRQFYQSLDLYLKLFGAQKLGRRNLFIRLPRISGHARIEQSELERILEKVSDVKSWYGSWAAAAADLERMASGAEVAGNLTTAGEAYVRASLLYHFGQLLMPPGSATKEEGCRKRVSCYRKAAPYCEPPAERIEVPFETVAMPGYLRIPRGEGPRPCVIMIDGADSTKEEYHSWSDELLKHGMASFTFDGPGQGELAPRYGGPPLPFDGYERAISRVIDYLRGRPEIDGDKIGGWGVSVGGYLISRAAARDSRIRAAVSLSGFYDCRDFASWPVSIQLNVQECAGLATLQETAEHLKQHCSLKGLSESISCPYLVVHGGRDDLVSVDEAKQMVEEARGWGELQLIDDAFHVCLNRKFYVTAMIVDWLDGRLRGR